MTELGNTHEKLAVVNDLLEAQLHIYLKDVPKYEYREIDNTPKHLIHQTEEDIRGISKEQLKADKLELIKEAKTKIVPVMMNYENRKKYLKPISEKNTEIENIPYGFGKGVAVLDKEGMTLEILRKI